MESSACSRRLPEAVQAIRLRVRQPWSRAPAAASAVPLPWRSRSAASTSISWGGRQDALRAVAEEAGGAFVIAADLATEEGRRAVVRAVPSPLHVLVHSAGAYFRGPVADDRRAGLGGPRRGQSPRAASSDGGVPAGSQRGEGHVVFINSTAGIQSGPNVSAYSAGKHALRAAADALRQEVNRDGIRVLSVFPGRTDTPMQAALLAQEGRAAPPGRLLDPVDVAAMIVAAIALPHSAEVTEIMIRPSRPL